MKRWILLGWFTGTLVSLATQVTISDPRIEGDTLIVPCVVADLSEATTLSLRLGASAPKDGMPALGAVASSQPISANGAYELTAPITLGTKIVCRVETTDGAESSEKSLTVADAASYTWKPNGDGFWSDATKWECAATDGLRRLGYPSYGSKFNIYGNQTDIIRVDAAYTELQGDGTLGWGGANITFVGTVPGATIGTGGWKDGQYDNIQVTIDGVSFPNLGTWHVKNNSSLVMRNGASIVCRWEVTVEGENAYMYVGPDCSVVVSNAEPYHRLGLSGTNAKLVIEDGTVNALKLAYGTESGQPAGIFLEGEHPQLTFREKQPLVNVNFNANGGTLDDILRTVRVGGTYAANVNLYPSDSLDNFYNFNFKSLKDNVITLEEPAGSTGVWKNYWTRSVPQVLVGSRYTYIFEILELQGRVGSLNIGRTGGYDRNSQHIQLQSKTLISGDIQEGVSDAIYSTDLVGLGEDPEGTPFNILDRGYMKMADHGTSGCLLKFRVSLYSGTSVSKDGFAYVAPGESQVRALPVPRRDGYLFKGWKTADGRLVTDAFVVTDAEEQTLTAEWEDLKIAISGQDRPRVGKPLTVSSGYEAPEGTAVTWKWFRGDIWGVYAEDPIATGDTYMPEVGDYEHWLRAVLYVAGERLGSREIWFSKLPVVYLNTDDGQPIVNKEDNRPGTMRLQGNDAYKQQFNGALEVKGRGNSSWGMPKKPYKLKLGKKTDLFGFGKSKHWVLIANFLDEALVRNKLAYDLSGELGLTYPSSEYVDVVFNGAYAGNYLLCEHIRVDADRVNIFDWEGAVENAEDLSAVDPATTDISGGYLWELSDEFDELSKFKTERGLKVMLNRPEFLYTNPAMMAWCSNFWETVTAGWRDPSGEANGTNYVDVVDVDSMAAYWLVQDGFGNNDASYKSRYCYKDLGGRMKFGPVWDFDWGCGSSVVSTNAPSSWQLAKGWGEACIYTQWMDDPWFCLKAWQKYQKFRGKFQDLVRTGGRLDQAHAYLAESGDADDRRWASERANWHASRTSEKQGFEGDSLRYKLFLTRRLAWIDEQFASLATLIESVRSGNSAEPYYADDRLVISLEGRTFQATVTDSRVASVDVRVNGRVCRRAVPLVNGSCSFRVSWDEMNLDDDNLSMVEIIGRTSEGEIARRSGNVILRNYLVVKPSDFLGTTFIVR